MQFSTFFLQISVEINPGLKSKDPLELVHVKAIGWNDTLHYIFGTIGAPSLVVALTVLPTNLTVNWTALNSTDPTASISFDTPLIYAFSLTFFQVSAARRLNWGSSGFVVTLLLPSFKLVEFNDVLDTGIFPEVWSHPAAILEYSLEERFLWSLTVHNSSSNSAMVSWNATDYNGTAFPSGMEFIIQV